MNWVSGVVLYILIWWLTLFAVLPIGTQAQESADVASGWRGAPVAPRLWRKVWITTLAACAIWALCYAVIVSGWIGFRDGYFALPK